MANFNIDYLVVAGGGGGGAGHTPSNIGTGGGGGAGGLKTTTTFSGSGSTLTLTSGTPYTLVVGSGGTGASPGSISTQGQNSTFDNITSTGGGGGGSYNFISTTHQNGGSGGGAGYGVGFGTGLTGQGNNGGSQTPSVAQYGNAGGGGAGAVGQSFTSGSASGNGGAGLTNSITVASGTGPYYAGGGGGGQPGNYTPGSGGSAIGGNGGYSLSLNGAAGTANTGSGGGGAGHQGSYANSGTAGAGGSGIVIIRYTTAEVASYTATGLTPTVDTTTVSGQTILSFTTVGTGTITFTTPTPPIPPFSGTRVTNPVTGFESSVNIGLKLPSGTNDNFPTAIQGMIRNDTSETTGSSASAIIHYNGADWKYFAATESVDYPIIPSQNFNTVLYDGNSGVKTINTVGFQPDLVWTKARDYAGLQGLTNSINGDNTWNSANSNAAIGNNSSAPKSFNSLGFTLGAGNSNWNNSAYDYVSWNWKGGGAYVNNPDGSITSQVSANVAAGFSIVKYNSGTSAITAGHGLSQAVEMVICKPLVSGPWAIWSKDMATDLDKNYMPLTTATVVPNASSLWNYSNWGATKIGSNNPLMFGNSNDVICYCWHSVAGYSKIGSYIGNGNAVGTIVPLDFEPAWIMIKGVDEASSWLIIDNKRSPTNPASARLDADSSAIEYSGDVIMDLNSDGFQLKTASASKNANGKTFIYMAFAAS